MQEKVVDDSDDENSEKLSDSFVSDEEEPSKMQKCNRFQTMVTRSQRRSQGRRMRPSIAFDPFLADFATKRMETRSTKKRRLI
jgi:hypothetical protein